MKFKAMANCAKVWMSAAAALLLVACAGPVREPETAQPGASPWAGLSADGGLADPWQHQVFPGKRPSHYRYMRKEGRDAVRAESASSASMLRQMVRIEPAQLSHVRFSWLVPALVAGADVSLRDQDDSPVRVVLAFDGDSSKFSAKDAMLSELALALTGEPMPYATLMYVWSNHHAAGSVVHNPRTGRIRKIVLESGPGNLQKWLEYERDVRADYLQAFGELPGALISIGIMTDSDNTRTAAQAWYGPLRHWSAAQRVATAPDN